MKIQQLAIAAGTISFLIHPLPSFAKDKIGRDVAKEIAQIELQVVGKAPDHESFEQRLDEIEKKLFGMPQTGTLFDRLSKIRAGIASTSSSAPKKSGDPGDSWPAFSTSSSPALSTSSLSTASPAPPVPSAVRAGSESSAGTADSSPGGADATNIGATVPANSPMAVLTNASAASTSSPEELSEDGWPTALPRVAGSSSDIRAPLKAEVETTATTDDELVKSLKTAPEEQVAQKANDALDNGKYSLAQKLFAMLSMRSPKDPRYFYGAGMAYKLSGDYQNAFADLIMSWHLGNAPVYDQAVSSLIPAMKKAIDDTFKVTYNHQAGEPEAVLNAGVRMWKSNMTPQAVKLFEYILKNEPLYRGAAAYNLGAVAERDGNPKLALEYYKWAASDNHKLEGLAQRDPRLSGAINKSLNIFPHNYIENAAADMQQRVLRGQASGWNGWGQAAVRPQHWSSEVCPLCAISRTSLQYNSGEMNLQ